MFARGLFISQQPIGNHATISLRNRSGGSKRRKTATGSLAIGKGNNSGTLAIKNGTSAPSAAGASTLSTIQEDGDTVDLPPPLPDGDDETELRDQFVDTIDSLPRDEGEMDVETEEEGREMIQFDGVDNKREGDALDSEHKKKGPGVLMQGQADVWANDDDFDPDYFDPNM